MTLAPATDGQPIRILLVEDNDINRQLMSDYLQHYGYAVLELAHGATLTTVLAQFQPHLVLMDLKLPELDGYTLLQIMQQSEWQHIPVIVVSAFAFQSDRDRAMALGVRQYLVKPVKLQKLRQAIHEELQRLGLFQSLPEGQS